MNMKPCTDKHGQAVTCSRCFARVPLAEAFADLDGKPFTDYYCRDCADLLRERFQSND